MRSPPVCDILLLNHEPLRGITMAQEIDRLYQEGVLPAEYLEDSAQRISDTVSRAQKHQIQALSKDIFEKNSRLNDDIPRADNGPTLKNSVK